MSSKSSTSYIPWTEPCPLCGYYSGWEIEAMDEAERRKRDGLMLKVGFLLYPKLSGRQRDVFMCLVIEELTPAETANRLELDRSTIDTHWSRLMEKGMLFLAEKP